MFTEIFSLSLSRWSRILNYQKRFVVFSVTEKEFFVCKLQSSSSFKQITNYCKMYISKKNGQFYRICRCVNVLSFYWRFRFWIIHRSNHDTMSTTTLLLYAVDNWFHIDTAWFVFEISGNLRFCLLQSLTSSMVM